MKTSTRTFEPGEILVHRLQRSLHWSSLLSRFALDVIMIVIVWRLFHHLNRSFIESYILPWSTFGSSWLIAVNLFLSVVPVLVFIALLQDFLYTFFIELSLTNRRITGRLGGLFWLKEINLPLEQVRSVEYESGHLSIRLKDKSSIPVYGFPDLGAFLMAYNRLCPDPFFPYDEAASLPDAFTFQHAP